MICPICHNEKDNCQFRVKEMQIGLREEFDYIECSNCGCLFLKDIPEDISRYYDKDYAPHNSNSSIKGNLIDKFRGLYLSNNNFVKYFFESKVKITHFKVLNNLVSNNSINKKSSILDVGCGDGNFLITLKRGGFKDLTGIDLFIDKHGSSNGINIIESSLEDFNPKRKYDLIISNHSFEHMDNQLKNLNCFEKLLNDSGIIMMRIPIKSDFFWNKYGVNWHQIDAPRHFFLHTLKSFEILCNQTNLVISDIIFDSTPELIIASEGYMKNISTRDEKWEELFQVDEETWRKLENQINHLNKNNNGDQAIFLLKLNK